MFHRHPTFATNHTGHHHEGARYVNFYRNLVVCNNNNDAWRTLRFKIKSLRIHIAEIVEDELLFINTVQTFLL